MKAEEMRGKTDGELQQELDSAYRGLLNLRFRWHTHQMTNVYEMKKVRKDIARIRTVLTERAKGIR